MAEQLAAVGRRAYPLAMESLVSAEWLAEHLAEPDLVVVDASAHMPASGRNGREEYLAGHIPGARYLDIEAVSDHSSPVPHALPTAAQFAAAMKKLGIGSDDRIVVYDNSPLRTAARGWFMFRHFGASRVAILDGGLQAWLGDGHAVERGEPPARATTFVATEPDEVVTREELLAGLGLPWADARGRPRFEGTEADPRPGVAPGHAPGSRNLPYASLYQADGRFRPLEEIRALFAESGIDPLKPFVASCGSGVTANSLIFAAHLLGNDEARLYDGSWSEWGADPATPKVLGPA